jgi:adenylate cyclase class IV
MTDTVSSFEVEIRCHFNDTGEAYGILPFLQSSLREQDRVSWVTRFYGLDLFRSGELLREAEVVQNGQVRRYLGWKGPDVGHYANIRQEIDEEFSDGMADSAIFKRLGGREEPIRRGDVVHELERLGHRQFMSFKGTEIKGYDETFDIKVKMMSCPVLKWPLIVEIEKTAYAEEEAYEREKELQKIALKFKIENRMSREEPPSLLYAQFFSQ